MHPQSTAILDRLSSAPHSAAELCRHLAISQPTLSRRLTELGDAVRRFGPQKGIRYARRRQILIGTNSRCPASPATDSCRNGAACTRWRRMDLS